MKHIGNLRPPAQSRKNPKRIGRGQGSGHGGTSTRGHKGQKSRRGFSMMPGFEGGQMPYHRRIPKRGFRNPFRTEYQIVNVRQLQEWVDKGKLVPEEPVTPEVLHRIKAIDKKHQPVKVLGDGELSVALRVVAHKFSKSAKEKIEAAGGEAQIYGENS